MKFEKPSRIGIVFIFVSWIILSPCRAKRSMETKELMQAARLDDLVVLVIPYAMFQRASPGDPKYAKARECMAAGKRTGFVELLAEAAEKSMSPDELKAGHLFFNSRAGRKYADLTVWNGRGELALEQISSLPKLSKMEHEEVAKFVKTQAAVKLTTSHLFSISQTGVRIFELGAQIISACFAEAKNS